LDILGGDFRGDDSNLGDVLLIELENNGNVLSCNKLTQISGFSNESSISVESSFGNPIFITDINLDGHQDLVVGNSGLIIDPDGEGYVTDLLFFLFNEEQTIFETFVIKSEYLLLTKYHMGLASGHSLDGQRKIVVSSGVDKGGDSDVSIINLNEEQSIETTFTFDMTDFSEFGFMIDMEANSPYGNSEFFDPDDDSDGESDAFGYDVYSPGDIDGDGNEDLIVGAFNDDDPVTNAGSIYFLLLNSDDSLKDIYKLSNPNITSDDSFGHGITTFQSNNKTWLAVGAPYDDTHGKNSGAIYIYDFEDFPFFPTIVPKEVKDTLEDTKKTNSKSWVPNLIPNTPSDTRIWLTTKENFHVGFNQLISEGEIQGNHISSLNNIPQWIMTFLGEKWYDEEISDTVYYRALEYLYNNKIIQ